MNNFILPGNRRMLQTAGRIALSFGIMVFLFYHFSGGGGVDALYAITPAMLLKLQDKRQKLLDEARALTVKEGEEGEEEAVEMTEEQEARFVEIETEVAKIDKQIKRGISIAAMDAAGEQRNGPQTVETGDASQVNDDNSDQRGGRARVNLNEEETRAYLAFHTLRLMSGTAYGNYQDRNEAAEMLVRGGHYGEAAAQMMNQGMRVDRAISSAYIEEQRRMMAAVHGQEYRAAGDWYSTLVNADGAFLLPTVVINEIEEIAVQVGILLQMTTPFNHVVGTLRVPGGSGADSAMTFVAEGAAITSRIRAFSAVELNPRKVADIIPFTYEINVEAGPRILADIQRVMGRSYGRAVDDAGFNGDGTASYNSIDGILSSNRTPGELVLASGGVNFDDITPDELILSVNQVAPGARANFAQAFHPDMKAVFKTKKDTQGAYLFNWQERSDGIMLVGGIPTMFSEALPGLSASAVSTSFGVGGDFDYMKIALGGGLQTEEMRTGTITDADTGATVNLGTQDLRALKYRAFFDLDMNFENAFMKYTTAAS